MSQKEASIGAARESGQLQACHGANRAKSTEDFAGRKQRAVCKVCLFIFYCLYLIHIYFFCRCETLLDRFPDDEELGTLLKTKMVELATTKVTYREAIDIVFSPNSSDEE